MKKLILVGAMFISLNAFFSLFAFAGTCPEGFEAKNEYTYGDMTLCNNTGDKCCVPSNGGGGGQQ